jgi:hypothetical protein
MAIFSLNSTVIARAAGGLYGLKIGTSTMNEALAAANASSVEALLNALYARDFGTMKVADVAAAIVKNVGITGTSAAEAQAYVVGQLTASTNKGATVVSILNAFSTMTADTTFGAAATKFNAQIAAAVTYAQTAGNQDAAFDALGTNAGAAFNLTNIADITTAAVFNAPQVYVPGGTNLINSLQNDDVLTGAGTADVLNATLGNPNDNGNAEINPELKGIETLNLKFDATSTSMILDMQDSAGAVNVNISRIADGKSATVKNITEAATNKLSINNTNSPTTGTVTFSYTDDAASAAAQTMELTLSNAKSAAVVLQAASTNFGFETINLKSTGSSNSIGVLTAQDVQSLVISGDKNLSIGTTANTTGTQGVEATRHGAGLANVSGSLTSVNASALTGNLSLTVGAEIAGALDNTSGLAVKETITGGSGNDTIRLTDGAVVGGSTTNTDVIDGGAGTDTIVMVGSSSITASGTSTVPVANVKSIEALQVRTGHDDVAANNTEVADSVTVDANAFDSLSTIYVRNEGQQMTTGTNETNGVWTSAAEAMTATLSNLTAAQATAVTIAHGTTGNNGIAGNTLAVNLKTSTGTADTVGVTIVDGVNADARFNFTLSTTATENLTITDSDTESNTVALASFTQHTGTVTLNGGAAGNTLNLDTTTAGANGGLMQYGVDGSSTTDVTYTIADHSGTANQVKVSALTIAAGTFAGNIVARVTNPTATASATGAQSITLGTGNDILILDNVSNLTAGLGITDTLAGGTGTDTLVIDGDNAAGVALSASEFTNVTGFETFRFINNGRAADNSRTGTNSYSLTLNDAAVTQNAAANILNIVNDNGSTIVLAGGAVQANGGVTIDVRALSAGKNINYDGQETNSNGTIGAVSATTGAAAYTAPVANSVATAMTADRFIFADANINATAVIDGGADMTTGEGGVAGATRFGHIANADVLEVRNSSVVSLGDLAGIRNVGTIEFTNDTAAVQTSVLQLSDATVDALVNSTLATVSTNATTIAASYEILTVTALDNAVVSGASTQLNLDASLIVNAGNILSVTGGGGADTIIGGAGADTITGGAGADVITAGLGNDVLYYVNGDAPSGEVINGGTGTDTLIVTTSTTFAAATFGTTATNTALTNGSIENIVITSGTTGTFLATQLTGQAININATAAGAANLVITGANATANFSTLTFTVSGGANAFDTGVDTVTINIAGVTAASTTGTTLADVIAGSALADTIDGGSGVDTITGGGGLDVLTGSGGSDIFVSTAVLATNAVNITDFTTAADDFDFNGTLLNAAVNTVVVAAGATLTATVTAAVNTVFVINLAANNAGLTTAVTNYLADKSAANADLVEAAAVLAIGADADLDTDITALESVLIAVDNNHTDGVGESMVFRFANTTAAGNVIDAGELTLIGILGSGDLVAGDFV